VRGQRGESNDRALDVETNLNHNKVSKICRGVKKSEDRDEPCKDLPSARSS